MNVKITDKHVQEASKISAATMHEASGKIGALPSYIKPISSDMKICGRAYPIKGPSGCNLWLHRAIAKARQGDVLIADIGDDKEFGYWGDIMGTGSMAKGITGLVIDGCVRDQIELAEMGFPVFAAGLCIRGTEKKFDGMGSLEEPITIGKITINHGDLVLGDNDGVVIIPADQIEEGIAKSLEREGKEETTKEYLRKGKTTMEIYDWPENT
ncbi:MAG: RraA family protein [Pseudomonadota bacterium]|nr:RraA family protein [Pseudomonadota bacterium]